MGNNESIRMAINHWLLKPQSFKPVMRNGAHNLKVCDLIAFNRQGWKTEVIATLVEPEDLELIQTIPISRSGCNDKRIWHYTKNGMYSVRSGYYVAVKMMNNGEFGHKEGVCRA